MLQKDKRYIWEFALQRILQPNFKADGLIKR